MRLLNLWQGFRLSTVSPWYHSAMFMAALVIDHKDMRAYKVDGT